MGVWQIGEFCKWLSKHCEGILLTLFTLPSFKTFFIYMYKERICIKIAVPDKFHPYNFIINFINIFLSFFKGIHFHQKFS